MARYRIVKYDFAYVGDRVVRNGDIIEWDGPVGSYMEPLDVDEDEAPKPKARRAKAEDDGGALA